jgi:hypothetical protein
MQVNDRRVTSGTSEDAHTCSRNQGLLQGVPDQRLSSDVRENKR